MEDRTMANDKDTKFGEINLKTGMVPISRAASGLARLFKQAKANKEPIVVTQKGYPTGVILDVESAEALRQLGRRHPEQLREIMERGSARPTQNPPTPSTEKTEIPKLRVRSRNNPQK